MDRHNQSPFRKNNSLQFKRKGGGRKEKGHNSRRERRFEDLDSVDTLYRILCPSRKIGSVIGKGGSIVKSLRDETQAKITVAESVPGSEERVVIIYSPPEKNHKEGKSNDDSAPETEEREMEPNCPAQDALLKVHARILEDDHFGEMTFEEDNEKITVTARLLVPNTMVGCLIGKGGDVIQRLRSETGASIRVLREEHLPSCATDTDELVQISGTPLLVKKALYVVSTLLHQNPRKDKQPLSFPIPFRGQDFPPHEAPMWPHPNSHAHGLPSVPWREERRHPPSGFMPGCFDGVPPNHCDEGSGEFSMKILCSEANIGGVIGKAGLNVKQLQQETGTSIHAEDASTNADERVIRVSAFETLWNPRSQTIDAILELQNKTGEYSQKGKITTRILVPSRVVGCLLGQGGHVINEMRRRTQADIRILPKDDKPKCASEDEELVQISASFAIAKDALAEIASRLRARTLRDSRSGEKPLPVRPPHGLFPGGSLPRRGPPPSGVIGAGRYEDVKGVLHEYEPQIRHEYAPQIRHEYAPQFRHEYEPQSYPPPATRYPGLNNYMESKFQNDALGSCVGTNTSIMSGIGEYAGARVKFQDLQTGGSESVVGIHGHHSGQNTISQQSPYGDNSHVDMKSQPDPCQAMNAQQGPYHAMLPHYQGMPSQQGGPHQGPYLGMDPQPGAYQAMDSQQASHQGMNSQQYPSIDPQQGVSYQGVDSQQGSYQGMGSQQASYQGINPQQGSYQDSSGTYQSVNAEQGSYQSTYAPQGSYQSTHSQQNSQQGTVDEQSLYQITDAQQTPYQISSMPQQGSYKY